MSFPFRRFPLCPFPPFFKPPALPSIFNSSPLGLAPAGGLHWGPVAQPFFLEFLEIEIKVFLDQGRQAVVQIVVEGLVSGGQALPAQVAFVKDKVRVGGIGQTTPVKKDLSAGKIVFQDPAPVFNHVFRQPPDLRAAFRAVKVNQDLRDQDIVPEAQVGRIAATMTGAELLEAHEKNFPPFFKQRQKNKTLPEKYYIFAIMTIL